MAMKIPYGGNASFSRWSSFEDLKVTFVLFSTNEDIQGRKTVYKILLFHSVYLDSPQDIDGESVARRLSSCPVKVPQQSASGKGHGPRRRQFDNGQTLAANNRQIGGHERYCAGVSRIGG